MISLVLVSHVYEIAIGAKVLAEQMANAELRIEAVGGIPATTAPNSSLGESASGQSTKAVGTDAVQIAEAIQRCWSAEGVLLLIDLGSAVLSTELALDLLPDEMRDLCLISNAPLVEGAVMAAVEASLGHSLAVVNEAAEGIAQIPKVFRP